MIGIEDTREAEANEDYRNEQQSDHRHSNSRDRHSRDRSDTSGRGMYFIFYVHSMDLPIYYVLRSKLNVSSMS